MFGMTAAICLLYMLDTRWTVLVDMKNVVVADDLIEKPAVDKIISPRLVKQNVLNFFCIFFGYFTNHPANSTGK